MMAKKSTKERTHQCKQEATISNNTAVLNQWLVVVVLLLSQQQQRLRSRVTPMSKLFKKKEKP